MAYLLDDVYEDPVIASAFVGILAKYPSDPEVKAVFPTLSSTLIPHSQEVRFYRGDSFDIAVQVQDDHNPPEKLSIARAVMKFAAKLSLGVTPGSQIILADEASTVIKRSSDTEEITFANEVNGQALIHIQRDDTIDHPFQGGMTWDVQLTLPTSHVEEMTGTISTQDGTKVIMGSGTNFGLLRAGDILHVEGKHVLITRVIDDRALEVDCTSWEGGSGLDYNAYHGRTRTVASGPWECVGDVAR